MSQDELDFFGSKLRELDTVNRCYTWRILFDHVAMGKLAPSKFLDIVLQKLPHETHEQIVLFVLEKVSYLANLGFVDQKFMKPVNQVILTDQESRHLDEESFLNQLFAVIFKSKQDVIRNNASLRN